jgi:hypothetical protein
VPSVEVPDAAGDGTAVLPAEPDPAPDLDSDTTPAADIDTEPADSAETADAGAEPASDDSAEAAQDEEVTVVASATGILAAEDAPVGDEMSSLDTDTAADEDAAEKDAAEKDEDPAAETSASDPRREVTVVPGVPRYHNARCILIRFMGDGDLEKMTLAEARDAGCSACRACLPDQEPAD